MSIGSDRCACYDVKSGLVDKIKYACWGEVWKDVLDRQTDG